MQSLIGIKVVNGAYQFYFKEAVVSNVDLHTSNKGQYKTNIPYSVFEKIEDTDLVIESESDATALITMEKCLEAFDNICYFKHIEELKREGKPITAPADFPDINIKSRSQVLAFDDYISNRIRRLLAKAYEEYDTIDDLFLSEFNSHNHCTIS